MWLSKWKIEFLFLWLSRQFNNNMFRMEWNWNEALQFRFIFSLKFASVCWLVYVFNLHLSMRLWICHTLQSKIHLSSDLICFCIHIQSLCLVRPCILKQLLLMDFRWGLLPNSFSYPLVPPISLYVCVFFQSNKLKVSGSGKGSKKQTLVLKRFWNMITSPYNAILQTNGKVIHTPRIKWK